ncbi:hypothetical protein DdX_21579 [Ditylenchus destructor]|uniref:Uncharacterized protein n=1 Tax=Ditylenchus destructor TaxID=166010 RepID=A0AAD4QVF3_9BILA|nr:hypothetical protein DdX_21579 [Ditylenchus destructor]
MCSSLHPAHSSSQEGRVTISMSLFPVHLTIEDMPVGGYGLAENSPQQHPLPRGGSAQLLYPFPHVLFHQVLSRRRRALTCESPSFPVRHPKTGPEGPRKIGPPRESATLRDICNASSMLRGIPQHGVGEVQTALADTGCKTAIRFHEIVKLAARYAEAFRDALGR